MKTNVHGVQKKVTLDRMSQKTQHYWKLTSAYSKCNQIIHIILAYLIWFIQYYLQAVSVRKITFTKQTNKILFQNLHVHLLTCNNQAPSLDVPAFSCNTKHCLPVHIAHCPASSLMHFHKKSRMVSCPMTEVAVRHHDSTQQPGYSQIHHSDDLRLR